MEFSCSANCGICCEHVPEHPDIQHIDGVCVRFDPETRKCTDYDNRPDICNVCKTYDLYRDTHTEEEYLKANYAGCEYLKGKYLSIIGGTA